MELLFSFFFKCFVWVKVVQSYNSTNMSTAWEKSHFNLSEQLDFLIVNNLSIEVHGLPMCMLTNFNRWDITTEVYKLVY